MAEIQALNIVAKEDTPEKAAALINVLPKHKVTSEEFNKIPAKVNELVGAANKKTASLLNPDDDKFPTTKAVADALQYKTDIRTSEEFIVTSEQDVNNLDTGGKACIVITNSIAITGIKTDGFKDGQMIIIKNASPGNALIRHQSADSLPVNRIDILSGNDLTIRSNAWGYFRYSEVRQRVELFSLFGSDYLMSLINAGTQPRAVTVFPDGSVSSEPIMEFEVHDEITAGYNTLAAIVAAYPTEENGVIVRKKGFQVICAFTTPPSIFKKCGDGDDHWLKQSTAGIIKLT